MGFFKVLGKMLDAAGGNEVICKYCGKPSHGNTLGEAISSLQFSNDGCGRNCHEPVVTRRPKQS